MKNCYKSNYKLNGLSRNIKFFGMTLLVWALASVVAFAQRAITGKVTAQEDGSGLIGVSVQVKGTTQGAITDVDGNYQINVGNGEVTLVFSFVGYNLQEAAIGASNVLDVALTADTKMLGETVVTSFGIKREKKALTYSVTDVKSEELLQMNNPNVIGALQGKIPGAIITTSSGAPGAGVNIILRGINSLSAGANNQPLVVIDGMLMSNETVVGNVLPSAGSNASGSGEQFSQTNRLADLNPNDIENISILKGAAATALYGSQGSNGVIVVTTKKGATGKAKVTFSTSYTVDQIGKTPVIQNQFTDGFSGYRRFAPGTVFWEFGPIRRNNEPYFNNQKDLFQAGARTDNALSISGGNDKFTYLASLGYFTQQGIIPNTDFTRLSGRLNTSYQVSDWLKLTVNSAYSNSGGLKPNGGDKSIFSALAFFSPSYDVNNYKRADGSEIDYSNGVIDNPRWIAEFSTFTDNVNRYTNQIAADAKLLPWLKMRYQVGLDAYTDFRKRIAPAASDVGSQVGGYIVEESIKSKILTSDLLFTAEHKLTADLELRVLAGNQIIENDFNRLTVRGERFGVPNYANLVNATAFFTNLGAAKSRLVGVFGDVNLAYKNFLFFNVSARNDWTSTLPKGNRSFFYPAVGGSFLFTEAFKMPENILSYGKIRASYAEAGKGTDPYQVGAYYDFLTPFGTSSQTRLSTTISDPNLRPERTRETELGFDLRFFKNRLGIDFTYFTRRSVDLIQPLPLSNSTGVARYITNVGEIKNNGIEIALNTTPIRTKNWRWDVNFTFTKMQGEVVRIADSIQQFDLFDAGAYNSTPIAYRYKAGGKVGDLYGYKFNRHSSGALLIGANGFPTVNTAAYTLVGNALPDFITAANTSLSWKNITLTALFEWRKGGNVVDMAQRNGIRNGILDNTTRRYEQVVFNGVLADGTPNTRAVEINETTLYRDFARYNSASEVLMEDGSWLRLRNVTLAYSLPGKLLAKTPFATFALRVTGNNLWLDTAYRGYDPEGNLFGANSSIFGFIGLVTPPTRNFSIGANITFK